MKKTDNTTGGSAVNETINKAAGGTGIPPEKPDVNKITGHGAGYWAETLSDDLCAVAEMLFELISLHTKESDLKKSHKAYLHVREEMDVLCKGALGILGDVLDDMAGYAVECEYGRPANGTIGDTAEEDRSGQDMPEDSDVKD